jgi:metal-responsive CopG/Arc/MetJ family transcriptional regulator
MQTVKTAVSLQKQLFEQAEELARRMHVTRSRLFVLALEDYISRQQNRELLSQINAAYQGERDHSEETLLRKARGTHPRVVEGDW